MLSGIETFEKEELEMKSSLQIKKSTDFGEEEVYENRSSATILNKVGVHYN